MKKLLLPALLAIVAGVASATAATFVNAKKTAKIYAAHVADSVEKHVKDSTAAADSLEKEHKAHEAEKTAEAEMMTPADSIRAAHNEPTTLTAATKGVPNAADPKHGAPAAEHGAPAAEHGKAPEAHGAPVPSGHDAVPATKSAAGGQASKGKTIVPRAVDAAKTPAAGHGAAPAAAPVTHAPESVENALPESRIAGLFNKMQSKDAAKILEQMSDSDVRVILGKMNDKQAAAILIAFPASRAAAISRGSDSKAAPVKTDSSKTPKPAGEHK